MPYPARFMAANMIETLAMLSASSQATGRASKAQKTGAGSANLTVTGTFTGTENVDYVVEIQTTGEIGVATFRWSDDGGASWDASGVVTSTAPVALNNGVSVQWSQGSGNDVVALDRWAFKGFLPYHRQYLLDRDRDFEWRSAALTGVTLTADLGAAKTPQAAILLDHNLSAGASLRLQASSVSNFATLGLDAPVPWQTARILYYLGGAYTFRYWRWLLSDTGNTAGYLRAAEWFLGAYTQLTLTFSLGDTRGKARTGRRERLLSGKYYGELNAVVRTFDLSWIKLSQTDRDLLVTVFDDLHDLNTRQVKPVFFNPNTDDLSAVYLCEWQEGTVVAHSEVDAPERFTVPVRLVELPRTMDTLATL